MPLKRKTAPRHTLRLFGLASLDHERDEFFGDKREAKAARDRLNRLAGYALYHVTYGPDHWRRLSAENAKRRRRG